MQAFSFKKSFEEDDNDCFCLSPFRGPKRSFSSGTEGTEKKKTTKNKTNNHTHAHATTHNLKDRTSVPCFLTSHSECDVWNVKKYGAAPRFFDISQETKSAPPLQKKKNKKKHINTKTKQAFFKDNEEPRESLLFTNFYPYDYNNSSVSFKIRRKSEACAAKEGGGGATKKYWNKKEKARISSLRTESKIERHASRRRGVLGVCISGLGLVLRLPKSISACC